MSVKTVAGIEIFSNNSQCDAKVVTCLMVIFVVFSMSDYC